MQAKQFKQWYENHADNDFDSLVIGLFLWQRHRTINGMLAPRLTKQYESVLSEFYCCSQLLLVWPSQPSDII